LIWDLGLGISDWGESREHGAEGRGWKVEGGMRKAEGLISFNSINQYFKYFRHFRHFRQFRHFFSERKI